MIPDPRKIAVLTGAGISAPSGLGTFRDQEGLWAQVRIEDVATPEAWDRQPEVVLDFYNQRRAQAAAARPNAAHEALAALQERFEVVVITQNVDDLHERAGSRRVLHVHGELTKARSTLDPAHVVDIGARPLRMGERCPRGGQLRPHIVWFGEEIFHLEAAAEEVLGADRVLVVGTSLQVYPAAGLVAYARHATHRVLIDPAADLACPPGFRALRGSADEVLPPLAAQWLGG